MRETPVWAVPRGTEGVRIMVAAVTPSMTVDECLAGTGLTSADLANEDCEIWAHQEFTVVRNIIAHFGDVPGLGIEVGGFSTLGRAGVLGFAVLASATVREGIQRALPYLALSPSHVLVSLEDDDENAYIVADDSDIPLDVRPFIVERDLAGLAAILHGVNAGLAPEWLETTLDDERAERLAIAWHLTADVRPNQARNRIAGPRGMLDVPLPQADPTMARIFERQCRELVDRRLARVGLTGQVRSRLLHNPARHPSMQQIADELHVDPRTLRRKLASEGTSFRSLDEEVRRQLAIRMLEEHQPVEVIAERLGYAETASFTHAFTRWEGMAPSRFRARST